MAETTGTALIVGASRGLGLGLVEEYLSRGWHVMATVRDGAGEERLGRLAETAEARLTIERADITDPATVAALHARLAERRFDLLFVVAGVSEPRTTPHLIDVPVEEFVRVVTTNTYWPIIFVERFIDLVAPDGTVTLMTSILASLQLYSYTTVDSYCVSKAGLNMATVCTAPRWGIDKRTVLLMHPGWVRTDMGTEDAPLDIKTSVGGMADSIAARHKTTGLHYVDYTNAELPW